MQSVQSSAFPSFEGWFPRRMVPVFPRVLLKNSIHTNKQTPPSQTHALWAVGLPCFLFVCVITQLEAHLYYGGLHINTQATLLCRLGHSPSGDQGLRNPLQSGSSGFVTHKSFAIRPVSFAHVTSLFFLSGQCQFFTRIYCTLWHCYVTIYFSKVLGDSKLFWSRVRSRLLLQTDRGCN